MSTPAASTAPSSAAPAPHSAKGRRLSRAHDGRPAAPVRIVHLGLGNFFRAHQCWFTDNAPDAAEWGIAAFTGMGLGPAEVMAAQDNLYTLVVNHPEGPRPEVISSIVAVHGSDDHAAWLGYFADPALSIVTSTVTEAGYRRNESGGLDVTDPAVAADIAMLRVDPRAAVTTAPGKFVAGLLARRAADAGPLTFVPCDNVPDNGDMAQHVITDGARAVDPTLLEWMDANVGFVTTMVDRITPRATDADHDALLAQTGIDDPALVVTEPFIEWVLAGQFVTPRPAWDAAGATFVEDIVPFENRKLRLLNGSHSLMAYGASIRGAETVADAIADPVVEGWVQQWWDDAARHLPLHEEEIASYRAALLARYRNPNIRHLLAQIAADGTQKIPIRIVPTLLADRAAGSMPSGAVRAVAAWLCHLRGHGAPITDAHVAEVAGLVTGSLDESARALCGWLGIADDAVAAAVASSAADILDGA